MPGDYSKVTFNPFRDHLGVLMQQGRVMLDADFNELVGIVDRRFRAETVDIIGRCVVPKETPDGFRIEIAGTSITIGRGRLYAHGLLAENHGEPPLEFDRVLAEERGTLPTPYDEQPYLPDPPQFAPFPAEGGPHLVYADVWQREVTFVENPGLVEQAVGVDTTTRLVTVWQVKVLPNVPSDTTCSTPDADIPEWLNIISPSAARLTTSTVGAPAGDDPCVVNPSGGFRGVENRLYRVEVHDGGPLGSATFKWSRDNASIATAVTAINAGRDVLTVVRTGRDAVLRFSPGDWVEVIDDRHELYGLPGEMHRVQLVDDVASTIELETALTAGEFDIADPAAGHTRVRLWDQKGQVFDAGNNVVADVEASGGVIAASAAPAMVLEDGVEVAFTDEPAGGNFRTGDYWVFAARTVDGSLETLTEAPPFGIHHHYCRLALVTFPATVIDCRTLWPPDFGGEGCDCTECVSAESHNNGTLTIQMAIDNVRTTGGKVCLGPGIFNIAQTPVQIQGAQSVQLQGHGWRTILVYAGSGPAISVLNSTGIDIHSLSVLSITIEAAIQAVLVANSVLVRIGQCLLVHTGNSSGSACIGLAGALLQCAFRDNLLYGSTGVRSLAAATTGGTVGVAAPALYTASFGLYIEDNLMFALRKGVSLEGMTLHVGDTRVCRNSIYGPREGGVLVRGLVSPAIAGSRVDINSNEITCLGDGVAFSTDNTRVNENDIGGMAGGGGSGVVLGTGLLNDTTAHAQIIGNRISSVAAHGIAIEGHATSLMIKQNFIDGAGAGGIVTEESGQAGQISIENNQVLNSGLQNNGSSSLSAIRVSRAAQAHISGNIIQDFAVGAVQNPVRFGIEVVATSSAQISGNNLAQIGPPSGFVKLGAGIWVQGPFDQVDVFDNSVRRGSASLANPDSSVWFAVRIAQVSVATPGAGPQPGAASGLLFPFVTNVGNSLLLVGISVLAVLPRGREIVAVRGNLLEAYGIVPAADISSAGPCTFDSNRCLLAGPATAPTLVVSLRGGAIIVNANYVQQTPASTNSPAVALTVGSGPFTVLGNIVSGQIRVNNAALGAPWAPLNVIAV